MSEPTIPAVDDEPPVPAAVTRGDRRAGAVPAGRVAARHRQALP
ncbi:MAG TPA: hypothetical protein VKG45_11660 [Actinomycetes bacterium]|nr:hypothetical protein [Actinomycetes bacterium]